MNEKELIKRKETDLEIADFLWEVLRRWRLLLVCMLAGAVLLSGMQLVKDTKAAKATPEQVQVEEERTLEEMEQALGAQDMDEVLGAVAMKKQLDEKSCYVKESELMQINPYEEHVVYLQYCVGGDSAETDYADFFEQHILSGANASELVDLLTAENNGFVVRVRGVSGEACKEIAEGIKADLEQYAQSLGTAFPGISLTLLEETSAVVVDTELADLQNETSTMIKQLNNDLDSLKSNMTGNQLALYVKYTEQTQQDQTQETDQTETGNAVEEVQTSTVHFSFFKFVLGAVIGLVLAIVWVLLAFVCSVKLRSEAEVKTLYRTNVLGNIRSGKKNSLDRLILKWRYHRAGTLTLEEEINLVGANIKVACGNDHQTVYLTGSDMSAVSQDILNQIIATCKDKGIQVILGSEISYHAQALEQMANVGCVVFVEQLRGTYYDEIYKEITTCMEHEIPILGMVVIGA